jgi:SNF2 family DNA or RNA helicase
MTLCAGIIDEVRQGLSAGERKQGEVLYRQKNCALLSWSPRKAEFALSAGNGNAAEKDVLYSLHVEGTEGAEKIIPEKGGKKGTWDRYTWACLLRYEEELENPALKEQHEYKRYTREGMIKRVLDERREKAEKAAYRIEWAGNIYGGHILTNEKGTRYTIFLRDFENETGYSDSADAAYNKLGTTKHIMYVFARLKADTALYNRLDKTFPFIEIYCDPLNDYRISWYYPGDAPPDEKALIQKFFKNKSFIDESKVKSFLNFIESAGAYEAIHIRAEVREKVERRYEDLMLRELREKASAAEPSGAKRGKDAAALPDFSRVKTELFPYQIEGINFALYRRSSVIADEMGLGKTLEAIGTAVLNTIGNPPALPGDQKSLTFTGA